MIRKFLLTSFLLLAPNVAWAQCTGIFPAQTACGNQSSSSNTPSAIPFSAIGGVSYKAPVKLASTANLTLSGEQTIDGVLTSTTRVLAKNQTVKSQNGCYITATGVWTRCVDFTGTQVVNGTQVLVTNGTANAGKLFRVNTPDPITVGTTAVDFSQRNVVANIQDFGGRSDESTDNGPACIAAMNSLALDTGGTIVFPASPSLSSNYLFTSECTIPKFTGTAFVRIVGYGANLGTRSASALRIFNRQPVDITDALNIVGARFSFEGMTIFGNLVTGQVGIWLGASYTSIIKDATLWNLDVGFDGVFCLACKVENVHGQTNKTAAIRFETGLGNFTGGTTLNSASNDCIIDNTRDFARGGATASYQFWGVDGCALEHSVSEGGDPINDVDFNTQGSGVVRSFKVDTVHVENSPTTAHFKVQGGGGPGVYSFKNIVDQSGSISLMIDASTMTGTQATIVAADIPVPFAGAYFSTPGLADVHWQFNNIGGGGIDLSSPTFWAGGVVPYTMKQDDFSPSASAPVTSFSYRYYLGSSTLPLNDTSGLYLYGNTFGVTDDAQSLGTNSALSTTSRLKYVMTGPTGGFLGYNGASLYLGTAIPAGGVTGTGLKFSSTANYGFFFSSGTPTLSAAKGSLAITDDGPPYYNNNGTTGWTQLGAGWHTLKQVNVEQTVVTGTTSKTDSYTFTVPANTIGQNGRLRVVPIWRMTNANGTRTAGVDYGGTTFWSYVAAATVLTLRPVDVVIANRNSTSAQIEVGAVNAAAQPTNAGQVAADIVTGSVATTSNQTLSLWCTLASALDTCAIESVLIEVNNDNP